MELASIRLGRPLRVALLTDLAHVPNDEIAERLGISSRTLERWLERLGLERRSVIVEGVHTENGATSPDAHGKPHPGDTADVEVGTTGAHPGA